MHDLNIVVRFNGTTCILRDNGHRCCQKEPGDEGCEVLSVSWCMLGLCSYSCEGHALEDCIGRPVQWKAIEGSKYGPNEVLVRYKDRIYRAVPNTGSCSGCDVRGEEMCIKYARKRGSGALCEILGKFINVDQCMFKEV